MPHLMPHGADLRWHQHEVGFDRPERIAEPNLGGARGVIVADEVGDQALLDAEHRVRAEVGIVRGEDVGGDRLEAVGLER